jgi:hypothetical protein
MLLRFDENGNFIKPTVLASPKGAKKIVEVYKKIEETPELKKKMEKIINQKKREWNARENSRKLVG